MSESITVQEIKSERDQTKIIEIRVYYSKGGMNLGTSTPDPRGYWLSATPITVEHRDGMTIRGFRLFAGSRVFLEQTGRYNAKRLQKLAAGALNVPELAHMVEQIKAADPDFAPVAAIAADPPHRADVVDPRD